MAIQAFIDHISLEKKYSPNTLKAYKKNLDDFQKFILSNNFDISIEKVTYQEIRSWIVFLVEQAIVKELLQKNFCFSFLLQIFIKTETISISP